MFGILDEAIEQKQKRRIANEPVSIPTEIRGPVPTIKGKKIRNT